MVATAEPLHGRADAQCADALTAACLLTDSLVNASAKYWALSGRSCLARALRLLNPWMYSNASK